VSLHWRSEQAERVAKGEIAHLSSGDLGAEDVTAFERAAVSGEC
jgi:hypothetical protein